MLMRRIRSGNIQSQRAKPKADVLRNAPHMTESHWRQEVNNANRLVKIVADKAIWVEVRNSNSRFTSFQNDIQPSTRHFMMRPAARTALPE